MTPLPTDAGELADGPRPRIIVTCKCCGRTASLYIFDSCKRCAKLGLTRKMVESDIRAELDAAKGRAK